MVIDAGVMIGVLDAADAHHETARSALAGAVERGDQVLLPASALAECLVGPARSGDDAVELVRTFLTRFPIAVVPLDAAVAEAAARLRASHGARLRLPDALVVATAQLVDADVLVTTDRQWPGRSALGLRAELVLL
ncbi:MAG: type II toxin-antitoxin system VapC family toxin [Chloroflexi bacterium]|nr:type II toxin-antitoxin system VapC family toxin [Chloroflexota bacterium]